MTLTLPKFYGGYEKFQWTGNRYLGTLSKRFLRVGSFEHEGSLYLPPANVLPIIRGGAIFTIWNVGYHNILLKDNQGGSVGCIQGTGATGVDACWTNVFLLDSSTAAGEWHINCATCVDPHDSTTTDSTFSDDCIPGVDCETTTTTTETDDDGNVHHHQAH